MFLAALLDLGLSRKQLESDLAGLGVDLALLVRTVRPGGLAGRPPAASGWGARAARGAGWNRPPGFAGRPGATPSGAAARMASSTSSPTS